MSTMYRFQSEKVKRNGQRPLLPDDQLVEASICSNCINRDGCAFLMRAVSPVHYCELYECSPATATDPVAEERKAEEKTAPGQETSPLIGLCVNCANREKCCLPRPQSGVLHCEEYV